MNNIKFVKFCKMALDKPVLYMWGTYGSAITESLITAKTKQYPTHYDAAYQAQLRAQIGKGIACDCTGLIKWFLWTGGDIDKAPKYDGATDNAASTWYNKAKVRGLIETIPEREGLIVSMKGHCGVYIGNNQVIECTKGKHGNGVVQTDLAANAWEKWCELVYISYESEKPTQGQETALSGIPAKVIKDSPTYCTLKRTPVIGNVYQGESVTYLGDYGGLAAIIYPTAASEKIAFVDKAVLKM